MPLWIQHTLVLLIVAAALLVLLRQAIASVRGRGAKLGSCCAKGCEAQAATTRSAERIVFLSVDSLTASRRK